MNKLVSIKIKGIKEIEKSIKAQVKKINNMSMKGLIDMAIVVRRSTETESPITPLDTGNLRASWFITTAFIKPPNDSLSGKFKGSKAAKMKSTHSSTISEMSAKAKASRVPFLIMGYSANYAVYVHEKMNAKFKRPNAGAKWLQTSLEANANKMIKIVAKEIKL